MVVRGCLDVTPVTAGEFALLARLWRPQIGQLRRRRAPGFRI
jgi:hypothetical protein